jgi:hypothetical protein
MQHVLMSLLLAESMQFNDFAVYCHWFIEPQDWQFVYLEGVAMTGIWLAETSSRHFNDRTYLVKHLNEFI